MVGPSTSYAPEQISARLPEVPQWVLENGHLTRSFHFQSFVEAFSFMTRCAFSAEALGHHPQWCNCYNRVDVQLWTHDAGGITDLDFRLAAEMDEAAASLTVRQPPA